ncbi:MAG TPA: hypothetical protein VNO32_65930 [Candidatus Acidoferrum sp.]|nr:hypothetical protein [Candidatus Acidoferrum sp.]
MRVSRTEGKTFANSLFAKDQEGQVIELAVIYGSQPDDWISMYLDRQTFATL